MVVFQRGQTLTKNDLNIFVRDENLNLIDPFSITYAVYDRTKEHPVLVGNKLDQHPARESVGYYWANIRIDEADHLGEFEIQWTVKLTEQAQKEVFKQRFSIVRKADPLKSISNTGGVAYYPGQFLGPQELYINILNEFNNPFQPHEIDYAIFDRTTGMDVLVSSPKSTPTKIAVGRYFANYQIPERATEGDYIIRWRIVDEPEGSERFVVQEFAVVNPTTTVNSLYNHPEADMLRRLRFLLRDNNPDRNYRFVPPDSQRVIQNFTETFGFMWTDEELYEYLTMAVDALNSYPPIEMWSLTTLAHNLRTMVVVKAASLALSALAINWIHDEFDYSIGGVSLQIDKSSKFQGMSEKFENEYQTALERYKDFGIKILKGIQQPKYGIGIASALGPFSSVGVQNRRNFIAGFRV